MNDQITHITGAERVYQIGNIAGNAIFQAMSKTKLELPPANAQYISLPFAIQLTKEEAWDPLDEKESHFFVVRLHFYLRYRQTGRHRVGETLALFDFTQGVSQSNVSIEGQRDDIKIVPTIRNSLIESDLIAKYVEKVAVFSTTARLAECSVNTKTQFKTLSEMRGMMQCELAALKQSFPTAHKLDEIVKQSVTIKYEVPLPEQITKPIIAVPVFQKMAVDIQLAWLDYLLVKYERHFFGLRKKKSTHPRVQYAKHHPNRVKCHTPLATFYYWKYLSQSCKTIDEENHQVEVMDSDEIVVSPPEAVPVRRVPFPKVPTLYQIARVAFPEKWIRRRHSQWTEDELMKIELEEAVSTPWWNRHGPGSSE